MIRAQKGFTLLELLIALALIGLIVTLLFGALRFSSKAWDSSEERLERDTAIVMFWQYLSDRFRQARNVSAQIDGKNYGFFQGEKEGLEFVSPMPAHLGSGGLYIIRLRKARLDGKQKLVLQRWFYHPEVLDGKASLPSWQPLSVSGNYRIGLEKPELRAWYSESILVDDMKDIHFSYYGIQEKDDEQAQWSDSWNGEKRRLPFLVQIQIEDEKGKWPEMIFELPGGF